MRSILMVAKETPERTALAAHLDGSGYLVLTADDPAAAMETLAAMIPGVMLIDLAPTAARRLIRQLRTHPGLRGIARLLVTGAGLDAGRPLPVTAAFARPLDPGHLVRALGALYPRPIALAQPGVEEPALAVRRMSARVRRAITDAQLVLDAAAAL